VTSRVTWFTALVYYLKLLPADRPDAKITRSKGKEVVIDEISRAFT
jgi:hypothetical protein